MIYGSSQLKMIIYLAAIGIIIIAFAAFGLAILKAQEAHALANSL